MGELQKFTEKELQARFDEKNGTWLYNIARGIDLELVQARFNPKSIGCCKQFRGKAALLDLESLRKWLKDLGDEIDDRLEKDALENNRTPKQMVVSYAAQMPDGRDVSSSRSYNFVADDELCGDLFSSKALELLMESSEGIKVKDDDSNRRLKAPIKFLGISVGKFEDISEKKIKKIVDYFSASTSKDVSNKSQTIKKDNSVTTCTNTKSDLNINDKEYLLRKFFGVPQNSLSNNESKPLQSDTEQINRSYDVPETDNQVIDNNKIERSLNVSNLNPSNIINKQSGLVLESSLDKQESFFAKMLNQNIKDTLLKNRDTGEQIRPVTPVCDVVQCGEDTNDTNYSGSTINDEINKSMALFDEDPEDVARVTSMRQLLNTSKVINDDEHEAIAEIEVDKDSVARVNMPKESHIRPTVEMIDCSECRKSIPIDMVETHADYHLALRLRDEERQQVRKEKQDRANFKSKPEATKKKPEQNPRTESVSSVANFLIKMDCNVATEICSECGKRIPLEKFGEHIDFHEARKLYRELNQKISPQFTESSAKRKRKSASPKKNKMPYRPIDSFFK